MIKSLKDHGNSKALIIDKSLLKAAGLDENSFFQITINPNGGITIQSIQKDAESGLHKKNVNKVFKEHDELFRRLADQ